MILRLAALSFCLAVPAAAAPLDVYESTLDWLARQEVESNPQGVELSRTLAARGKLPHLRVCEPAPEGSADWGVYSSGGGVCLGVDRLLAFYGAAGEPVSRPDWFGMQRQMGTMREIARKAGPDYYRELVRAWQRLLPGGAAAGPASGRETALRLALYYNELVKGDPQFLAGQAGETYYGGRSPTAKKPSSHVADYFAVCYGKKAFLERADRLGGGGRAGSEEDPGRAAYARSVDRLADRVWPALWKDAALNGGRAALSAGDFPRALRCLVPDPAEVRGYGLPKADETAVYSEGERALVFAAMKLRAWPGGDMDEYAALFRAVEEAYARLGRPLPSDLAEKRAGVYELAREFYARTAAAEKDRAWRNYLLGAGRYFSR